MQQERVRPAISAVMVSCHEAEVIEPCPLRVASRVAEIVVMDMHTTYGTREIAQRYGAWLADHERLPHANPAHNLALEQAAAPWILALDSDERVPEALARELQRIAGDDVQDVIHYRFQAIAS